MTYSLMTSLGKATLAVALLASGWASRVYAQPGAAPEPGREPEVAVTFAVSALRWAIAEEARSQPEKARERFAEAAEELVKATEVRPEDGDAQLLLGLAYLFLGDEPKAAAALERGREAGDRLRRLAQDAGRSLADGDRRTALGYLEDALAKTSDRIRDRLAFDRPPLWAGQWSFGISTDSNPNLLDDDLILLTPEGELVDGNASDQVAHVDLRLVTRPLYERAGWTLGLVLRGGRSYHQSHDYLDLGRVEVVALAALGHSPLGYLAGPLGYTRVRVGASKVSLLLQGGTESTWLGGTSYRRALLAGVSIVAFPGRATATQADLVYRDRTYSETGLGDPRRSGGVWTFELSQTFFFRASDRFLRLGVLLADSRAGRPYASSSLEPNLEVSLPLGRLWSFHLDASLEGEDYDHPESDLFNPRPGSSATVREDSTWRARTVLERRLSERLALALDVAYTRRDSRPDRLGGLSLDYEKLQTGLSLHVLFGGAP